MDTVSIKPEGTQGTAPRPPVGFVAIGKQLRVTVPTWMADQFEGASLSAIITALPGGELDVIIQKDVNSGAHFGREVKGQRLLLITRDKVLGLGDLEFSVVACLSCSVHEGRKLLIRVPPDRAPLKAKKPRVKKPATRNGITLDQFKAAVRTVNSYLDESHPFTLEVVEGRIRLTRTEVIE